MPPRAHVSDSARLAQWCMEQLGSPPAEEIFRSGNLSAVIGLRLADDREVVVKVRPNVPRIAACVEVQRRMFHAGFPCRQPLTDAVPLGEDVATAEAYVPGGAMLPSANHAEGGLWPRPEDPDTDLNDVAGPEWIDDAGRRARDRLRASESEAVIGHCDWLAGNLRWRGDTLLVVHDWDSMIVDSEAVLVGFAAALYSTASVDELATVEDTQRFLDAYGRELSADERERSWAAGVWDSVAVGSEGRELWHAVAGGRG